MISSLDLCRVLRKCLIWGHKGMVEHQDLTNWYLLILRLSLGREMVLQVAVFPKPSSQSLLAIL